MIRFAAFALLSTLAMSIATPTTTSAAETRSDASAQLARLLDEDLDAVFRRNPLNATTRGVTGYNDRLPESSRASLDKERVREHALLGRLHAIDYAALKGQDRVSYQLLLEKTETSVEGERFRDADALAISTLGGIQNFMPRAAQVTPFKNAQDYRDYITRISSMPAQADGIIERLRLGLSSGWMSTKPVVERVVDAIDAHLVNDATTSVLMGPFAKMPAGISAQEQGALRAAALKAVADTYQPAMRRVKEFLQKEYLPKAPAEAGLVSVKDGKDYYEFLIRKNVVRGYSAEQIHQIGLSEVTRLRGEIGKIAKEVGYKGTTGEFINDLRTNPDYFFTSADAVLDAYRAMPPRIDPYLPKLFHHVPGMKYAIRSMTPAEAASSTAANYTTGSVKLGTPGYFTINANGYSSEAKWRMETLFLHEAVPGHHMQVARASEMGDLHPWRASGNWNVGYGEGWALYAERLGYDIGMFKDPYQRYGNIQAQLFRAARLVVDTGIHHYGWSRDKAIEYMSGEGGVDHEFSVSEVDRYFSNPSQALGYLMGFHKFVELRARAEKALGPKFNAKDFHAVCIDNGSITLAVLEKLVDEWIAGNR
ncbi:MAG TPA: DUF885 domain-containing protein [Usitatibacter sp.]|nr:DUF885 domain-containing protein [Usitatibacter sp.]